MNRQIFGFHQLDNDLLQGETTHFSINYIECLAWLKIQLYCLDVFLINTKVLYVFTPAIYKHHLLLILLLTLKRRPTCMLADFRTLTFISSELSLL